MSYAIYITNILKNLFHCICEYKNFIVFVNIKICDVILIYIKLSLDLLQILVLSIVLIDIAKKICTDEQLVFHERVSSETNTNRVIAIIYSHNHVKLA